MVPTLVVNGQRRWGRWWPSPKAVCSIIKLTILCMLTRKNQAVTKPPNNLQDENTNAEHVHRGKITHVYMFSIGFPAQLLFELSKMWNSSQSPYLICYHSPKDIIHSYNSDFKLQVIYSSGSIVTNIVQLLQWSIAAKMRRVYRELKYCSKEYCPHNIQPGLDNIVPQYPNGLENM